LQEFYKDVREIGIELELLDKRSVKGGERTFLEANLFTLKGDGNNILSWVEGYQELSNLMSGASVAQDIYDGIIKARSCPISGNKNLGIFGQRKIDFSCLKKNMRKNFSKYFADLPGIAEYVDGLSNNRWESFFLALTQVSPLNDFDGKWVELSHVRAFAVIVHFVETVILRYDFEHKGYLDDVEVDIAFRTYKGFLAIAWRRFKGRQQWKAISGLYLAIS